MMKKLYGHISAYAVYYLGFLLFLIPILYWGGLYHVGGDDTRMYYVMPKAFFEQYSSSIITQNRLGTYGVYASPAFLTPFYMLIWFLSIVPSLHMQFAMYGANMAVGFVFFYLLIGLYIRDSSRTGVLSKLAAALSYVLSNFLVSTMYTHELMSVYAVGLCPLLLYLFVRSIRERIYVLPVVCALIYSAVSATLITLPWYGAFFFSVLPLLLLEFKRSPWVFIRMSCIFLSAFTLLNIHWMIHLVASQFIQEAGSSAAISLHSLQAASRANANYIEAISHLNPILAQLFQQERTGWGMTIVFNPFNAVYLLPILLAGAFFAQFKKDRNRTIYFVSIFSFLLTVLLFTPNVDAWSLRLFLFFNSYIPLFAMFKTSYDKFALPLAFQYSFLLAWSLWIIGRVEKKLAVFLACAVILLTVYSGYRFLFPVLKEEKFSTQISGSLNSDFTDMVAYIKSMDTGAHYVWLPLTFPSYIYVEDKKLPNHFYSGPSVLTPLTNKIDYTGELSFEIPSRPGIAQTIIKSLRQKNYDAIGRIFQELGIRYLILNKQPLPAEASDYQVWLWGSNKLDALQNETFITFMKGKKMASFGDRYDVYEINPKYLSDVLYTTASLTSMDLNGDVSYKKNNESEYTVSMPMRNEKMYLVFLEPYYRAWSIYLEDANGKYTVPYKAGKNISVFGHGNAWELDFDEIRKLRGRGGQKNGEQLKLKIIFTPKRLQNIGNLVSIVSYLVCSAVIIWAICDGYMKRRARSGRGSI